MRLHLVGLPHTQVSQEFCGCAHTSKILKFARMMGQDYEILLYAPEGPPVKGAELIPCLSTQEQEKIFGVYDPARLPTWPDDAQFTLFNAKVIQALMPRLEPRDLILLSGGRSHKLVHDAFPGYIRCEQGVGYEGIVAPYCAFESYAWMHYVYHMHGITDGRWFDCMIPIAFDPADFPHLNPGKGEYLLFLGRLIDRKGPHIAAEIAKAAGMRLVVAGSGDMKIPDAEHVGPVGIEQRAKLLAGARALLFCTTYFEPFGKVMVEAGLAGTPVIATDWGAASEIIMNGINGFRFRSLQEAVTAVGQCSTLRPETIRTFAIARYSLDAIRPKYDRWFNRLLSLWKKGWYELT